MSPTAIDSPWFHVMNRRDDHDRKDLLPTGFDPLAQLAEEFLVPRGIEVHAYCWMGTHYHLLVCSPGSDPRDVLRRLDDSLGRGGDRGRPRIVPLTFGRPVAYVSRYIHLNPVEAGLVSRPEQWPCSSYRAYLDPAWCPPWVTTARILGWFGSTGARRRYRLFVELWSERGTRGGDEELHRRRVLGSIEPLSRTKLREVAVSAQPSVRLCRRSRGSAKRTLPITPNMCSKTVRKRPSR